MNRSQSRTIARSRLFLSYLVFGYLALAYLVLAGHAFGQTQQKTFDLHDHPFEASLPSGAALRVHLRDGDFRIVGGDSDKISVQASGANLRRLATSRFSSHIPAMR
jgi:hypothetical protein